MQKKRNGLNFSSPHFAFVWGGKEVQSLDRPVEEEVQNNQFFSRVGYRQLQTKQLGPIASNSRFTLASPLLHSFWLCWEPSRSKAGFINCGKNLNCLIIGRESSFHYTVRFRGMAMDYNCLWNEIHLFLQFLDHLLIHDIFCNFLITLWSMVSFAIPWSSSDPGDAVERQDNQSFDHSPDGSGHSRPKNFFRTPGILIWWNFVINGRSTQMRCKSFII